MWLRHWQRWLGEFILTIKKSSVVKDDVADIGVRAGTDIPAQQVHAVKLNHEDGHHAEVLDVVGYYLGKPVLPMYLTSVSERSTMHW